MAPKLGATFMKTNVILGIALILIGVAILSYRGFSYTSREEVLTLGPLKATAETTQTVPIPALLGWAAIAGGAGVLIFGTRRKS